jgi:hypothetical protein
MADQFELIKNSITIARIISTEITMTPNHEIVKAVKISGGPLIRVVALKKGDRVHDLQITGSIHCTPITLIEDMEKTLREISISESTVRARVEAAFKQG